MTSSKKTRKDDKGRFTSEGMIGNKNAKRDFKRELAKKIMSDELKWAAHTCCSVPTKELKRAIADGMLDNESILTYTLIKKFVQGDSATIRFLTEMIVGKAVQRVDQIDSGNEERIERLEDYIKRTSKK